MLILLMIYSHFRSSVSRDNLCCGEENLLSCSSIDIFPEILVNKKEINILGTKLYFSNRVEPHGYAYKNNWQDEAVFTYNKKTGSLFGSFHIHGRGDFEVEKCHDGHVIKQREKETVKENDIDDDIVYGKTQPMNWVEYFWGTRDQTSIATFTVKFYYTEEFAKSTFDIEGWTDSSIALINQAMINSLVPVRMKKFATEMAMIPEYRDCS